MHRRTLSLIALATAAALILTGCCGLTEPMAELIPIPFATATARPAPSLGDRPKSREVPEISRKPEPLPTATPVPAPVAVVQQGFGQQDRSLGYGFVIENPNPTLAVNTLPYEIAFFDEEGALVGTDTGYVQRLLPAQTLGVAGTTGLDEGVTVAAIEVRLRAGEFVAVAPQPGFVTEYVVFEDGPYGDRATGIVRSPYPHTLTEVRVSALATNDDGTIIGGGFTYLNFILAESATGVQLSLTKDGEVAGVALYPVPSGLSSVEAASGLDVRKTGYGQRGRSVGYGFLIENPDASQAMEGTQYRVTAYDGDGRVLTADQGYVTWMLPGQTLGVGGTLSVGEGQAVARLDAQVLPGERVAPDRPLAFEAESVAYQGDDYTVLVTGRIANPYGDRVSDLRVFALAYDRRGAVIGGGDTYLDAVRAKGRSDVEVRVIVPTAPARVELYATLSNLSEFR
jgi:hypothetical protein